MFTHNKTALSTNAGKLYTYMTPQYLNILNIPINWSPLMMFSDGIHHLFSPLWGGRVVAAVPAPLLLPATGT